MAPRPVPLWLTEKTLGSVVATRAVTVLEATPAFSTAMAAVGPEVSYGVRQLIWFALTSCSGAGLPPIVTRTPFSVVGYGGDAVWVPAARPVPKSAMNSPGAIGVPGG